MAHRAGAVLTVKGPSSRFRRVDRPHPFGTRSKVFPCQTEVKCGRLADVRGRGGRSGEAYDKDAGHYRCDVGLLSCRVDRRAVQRVADQYGALSAVHRHLARGARCSFVRGRGHPRCAGGVGAQEALVHQRERAHGRVVRAVFRRVRTHRAGHRAAVGAFAVGGRMRALGGIALGGGAHGHRAVQARQARLHAVHRVGFCRQLPAAPSVFGCGRDAGHGHAVPAAVRHVRGEPIARARHAFRHPPGGASG